MQSGITFRGTVREYNQRHSPVKDSTLPYVLIIKLVDRAKEMGLREEFTKTAEELKGLGLDTIKELLADKDKQRAFVREATANGTIRQDREQQELARNLAYKLILKLMETARELGVRSDFTTNSEQLSLLGITRLQELLDKSEKQKEYVLEVVAEKRKIYGQDQAAELRRLSKTPLSENALIESKADNKKAAENAGMVDIWNMMHPDDLIEP